MSSVPEKEVTSRLLRRLTIGIQAVGMAMVVYHFIGVFLSPLDPTYHINTHLTFALLMVFLPALAAAVQKGQKLGAFLLLLLTVAALGCVTYVYVFSEDLQIRSGLPTTVDVIIGVILLIAVFEACRTAIGLSLPLFAVGFVAYGLLGQYLPGPFYHAPVAFDRLISWLAINLTTGIYSSLLFISANIVFLFIMFASLLEVTKAREFFIIFGSLVGSKIRGGPAQTAVVSSALVGTITGSGAANVVITGSVTIPLMKKIGFKPEMAAAVEAVASSGGMLMPPVMGTAAFIMVSLTGITYAKICSAAIIPALLYYISAGVAVYLYAGKAKIPLTSTAVDYRLLLRRAPLFIIPFSVLVVLLALGYSAAYAAGLALIAGLFLGFISKETRPSFSFFVETFTRGAETASQVGVMLALAGTFMAIMSLTQLGVKVVYVVEALSGGHLAAVLFLTMVTSLLLGCVVPMSGGYLLVALLVTPILTRMGVTVIQAHFFALFFSLLGWLTPPVAPSVIIAARLAKSSFLKTAWESLRIAAPCFVVPFMFVYNPALLGNFSSGILWGLISIVAALLVVASLAVTLFNYYFIKISWLERLLTLAALVGSFSFFPGKGSPLTMWFFAISVACFLAVTLSQVIKWRVAETGRRYGNR